MKKNYSAIIVGAVLIFAGIFIFGKAFDIIDIDLFFDGWWTVFIIVPCLIGFMNTRGSRTSYLIGLGIGVLLFVCAQGWIRWGMFAPVLIAVIFLIIGLRLIIGEPFSKKLDEFTHGNNGKDSNSGAGTNGQNSGTQNQDAQGQEYQYTNATAQNMNAQGAPNPGTSGEQYAYNPTTNTYEKVTAENGAAGNSSNFNRGSAYTNDVNQGTCVCTAVLAGRDIRFDNEVFRGAMLSAFLGGIELDLRNAIITGQVTIEAKAVLGSVTLLMPLYVRTVVNGTPILGGIDNSTRVPPGANEYTPVVIVNASCILGGIEVK